MKCYLFFILFVYYRIHLLFKFIDRVLTIGDVELQRIYPKPQFLKIPFYDSRWSIINKSINTFNKNTNMLFSYLLLNFLFFYVLFILDDLAVKLINFSFIFYINNGLFFMLIFIIIVLQNGFVIFYKNRYSVYSRYLIGMNKRKYKIYAWALNIFFIFLALHFIFAPFIHK